MTTFSTVQSLTALAGGQYQSSGLSSASSSTINNSGLVGSSVLQRQQQQIQSGSPKINGVVEALHYLRHEWSRYELDRASWEMERAELKARISFLVGERKAQENLKQCLVRRIKMLEFSLRQERLKIQRLTHNKEEIPLDGLASPSPTPSKEDDTNPHCPPGETNEKFTKTRPQTEWNEARQVLRQYFQEIADIERLLDARSRHRLGLPDSTTTPTSGSENQNDNISNKMSNSPSQGTQILQLQQKQRSLENGCKTTSGESALDQLKRDYRIEREHQQRCFKQSDGSFHSEESNKAVGIYSKVSSTSNTIAPVQKQKVPTDIAAEHAILINVGQENTALTNTASSDDGKNSRPIGGVDDFKASAPSGNNVPRSLTECDKMVNEGDVSVRENVDEHTSLTDVLGNLAPKSVTGQDEMANGDEDAESDQLFSWILDESTPLPDGTVSKVNSNNVTTRGTGKLSAVSGDLASSEAMTERDEMTNEDKDGDESARLFHWIVDESSALIGRTTSNGTNDLGPTRRTRKLDILSAPSGDPASSDAMTEEDEIVKDDDDDDEESARLVRWSVRYTLRSHYDSVRAMQFHPTELVLVTASEDGTAKLWDLGHSSALSNTEKSTTRNRCYNSNSGSGSGSLDIEPIYTFRGHKGPILAMDMSPTGDSFYTAGRDGTICCWAVPPLAGLDSYQPYDRSDLQERLLGHTDCVWALAYHSSTNRLISASADTTIRLWMVGVTEGVQSLIHTFQPPSVGSPPTAVIALLPRSIDLVSTDPHQLLTAYTGGRCSILDLDTGKTLITFQPHSSSAAAFSDSCGVGTIGTPINEREVNRILAHPTMPVTITAGDDRQIRYYDNNTGQLIHSTVAHVESISTLAIDPNGLYLLSGSHDGSLRFWNVEKRTCLQEIAAHRKKYNEGVFAVAFHPSRPLIGSAGADSLAKVFGSVRLMPSASLSPSSPTLPNTHVPSSASGAALPGSPSIPVSTTTTTMD